MAGSNNQCKYKGIKKLELGKHCWHLGTKKNGMEKLEIMAGNQNVETTKGIHFPKHSHYLPLFLRVKKNSFNTA